MGLDIVEIVLRCEEEFDVQLEDWRLGQMRTVGDLFELICEQLKLQFGKDAPFPKTDISDPGLLSPVGDWTRDTVWSKVVSICVDQQQVDVSEVRYDSKFLEDLGVD